MLHSIADQLTKICCHVLLSMPPSVLCQYKYDMLWLCSAPDDVMHAARHSKPEDHNGANCPENTIFHELSIVQVVGHPATKPDDCHSNNWE